MNRLVFALVAFGLLFACRARAQEYSSDHPDVIYIMGDYISCSSGFKLQRYSAGRPGNMVGSAIIEDLGEAPSWYDVDPKKNPHDGDYRCVKTVATSPQTCPAIAPHNGDVAVFTNGCWKLMLGGGGSL
jgi:hypothetical protein